MLQQFFLGKAKKHLDSGNIKVFENHLKKANVALLLNERIINIPPQIIPDMHAQLPEDIAFTKVQDDIKDPSEFDFDYVLILTRFTKEGSSERKYYKFEDEVLLTKAIFEYEWKTVVKDDQEERAGTESQHKLVYMIKYTDYVGSIAEIKQAAYDF